MEENTEELSLIKYEAVQKFKSVRRAIRRGHVSRYGIIYPRRPFNNRTSGKHSRPFNELKKGIYGQFKSKGYIG